jgi:PBSX family phage terminase large subunit
MLQTSCCTVALESRSGKTFILVFAIFVRAFLCPKSRHAILRLSFNHAKRSIWLDTLPKVLAICFPNVQFKYNNTDFFVTLPNGSEVWVGGLDNKERVEKILGQEYSTIFFNECSQIPYSSINMALTRLAQKNKLTKKAYYDENPPTKKHWSYWLFVKHLNPDENIPVDPADYASMLMNPQDNLENIDENYIKLLNRLPESERQRFLYGQFGDSGEGLVYYAFDREEHVGEYPHSHYFGTVFVGMDFNVDPMSASICYVVEDKIYVVDEIFLRNSNTFQMSKELVKKYPNCKVIPDSTGRNRKTSGKSDHVILRDAGLEVMSTRNPFVTDRINNVNRLLEQKRLIISSRCKKLINDLEKVTWKEGRTEIDKSSDHLLTHISDSMGYACHKLFPLSEVTSAKIKGIR